LAETNRHPPRLTINCAAAGSDTWTSPRLRRQSFQEAAPPAGQGTNHAGREPWTWNTQNHNLLNRSWMAAGTTVASAPPGTLPQGKPPPSIPLPPRLIPRQPLASASPKRNGDRNGNSSSVGCKSDICPTWAAEHFYVGIFANAGFSVTIDNGIGTFPGPSGSASTGPPEHHYYLQGRRPRISAATFTASAFRYSDRLRAAEPELSTSFSSFRRKPFVRQLFWKIRRLSVPAKGCLEDIDQVRPPM